MTEVPEQEKTTERSTEEHATRRTVLKGLISFVGALGLGSLLYGSYRFLAPNAGAYATVELPLADIAPGGAYPFQYGASPGILLGGEDGTFRAFSLVCTHLSCTVHWNPEKRTFYCPCHDGLFDAEGNVISGPPPTSLGRLRVEVKGDKVIIGDV